MGSLGCSSPVFIKTVTPGAGTVVSRSANGPPAKEPPGLAVSTLPFPASGLVPDTEETLRECLLNTRIRKRTMIAYKSNSLEKSEHSNDA